VIYAAEKALYPAHNYEIAGTLTTAPVLCVDERAAVNQATQALSSAKSIVQELEAEFQRATGAQKQALRVEIMAAEKDVAAAQAVLDAANKALQACLMRSPKPIPTRPVR
jgi:chromosome segregation ATPase